MKKLIAIILIAICPAVSILAHQSRQEETSTVPAVRFAPLHVYIDSHDENLAAFQFELKVIAGSVKIVGVEGGEHQAFKNPPYYDPAALANDRIIVAAFNTGQDLPAGQTRITTIHLQIIGDIQPEYQLNLIVAANADGQKIPTNITFEKGEPK
jgi:hypothetical protein